MALFHLATDLLKAPALHCVIRQGTALFHPARTRLDCELSRGPGPSNLSRFAINSASHKEKRFARALGGLFGGPLVILVLLKQF